MKQEATKKPKKLLWLWIGLAALVLIAGAVVGAIFLFGGAGKSTGPVGGRPELYWNLDKEFYTENSESGLSTREPGADGVFKVRFAYNGEQVELPVADKQLINYIDTLDVMGIVKDNDGVVVNVIPVEEIATPVAQNAYVQQVMSDRIIANSSIAMNGMQYTIELGDLTQMYDVSDTAKVAGEIIDTSVFQAMDSIWVYANDLEEITHIYLTDHPETSPVYWRAYQMWSSAEKSTSRVPDENGVYSIDFCSDGGIVTLKCKDKSIVTSIDNKSPHSCHFGFIFDEEGYIIEVMNSGIGIRGAVAAERIEVTELDGRYFSGTQLIPSDSGLSYSTTLPEDCVIYDASSAAAREGRQGERVESLQLGDRICVWTDPMGTPVMVYIANRLADCDAYYNLERKYDGTKKETKREVDWAGYYTFEMIKTGENGKKYLKTKDKELATFIDSISNSVVGLKVENGIILNAYTDDDVFGWTSVWGGYVPQIQGAIVSLVSFSKPDSPTNVLMQNGYKAYDVSCKDGAYGAETTLRVGDIATVARDVSYNGVVVYITRRMVGGDKVYYNLDYQYNSKTKETKRVPDEEGWYYFTMAHNGKQVEVKTKSKELANKIDKSPVGDLVVVMRVVNGVAYEVYDTQAAYGQVLRSGYRIKSINGDGTYVVASSTGTEYTLKMADDCKIYNVSTVFDSHRGERCYSLKVGDMVTSLADYRGDVKFIYVRYRTVDKMYVNKQPLYDATNKVTLREPDEDGYYWYDLAVGGELKKFKTNKKELADQIDAYTAPFGLRVKGEEILNIVGPTYVGKVRTNSANGWDVTSVSKWSIGLKYTKPGYANTGKTQSLNLASNVKIYDISPTAEKFGAKVSLKKGDRVLTYSDIDKNVLYVYVLFHDSREKGSYAYCDHCDQKVLWQPWAGGTWDGINCHYYLAGDITYSRQSNIGNNSLDYEVVLDLNGKKFNAVGSRGVLIRYNDALTILDSVGGGEFAGTGINGNGGTFLMASGGILNLHSGTLSFIDSEDASVKSGAVIYADSSAINMYGGTITGGIVNTSETNVEYIKSVTEDPSKYNFNVLGGNLHLRNTTLNVYGGVIENGQAIRTAELKPTPAAQGGNIYAINNSVVNIHEGAEVRNGYSNQHGGNVFVSTDSDLNILGGKIFDGKCDYSGGNVYLQFSGAINLNSGIIENGAAAYGNNVYGAHDGGEVHLSGGNITGDVLLATGSAVSVSGDAKVSKGQVCGLTIPSAVKLTVGELKEGAEIYISANGAFSEPNENAQAYVDAGYIKSAADRTSITVEEDVLVIRGELSFCEHCGESVEWTEWAGTNSPASGHYFVGKDFKQGAQISIVKDTDVVVDLNGHTYSSTKIRNFLVRGTLSIMDSVGGGEMVTTGGAEFAGSIAMVGNDSSGSVRPSGFNLYSGTLRLDTENAEYAEFNNAGLISFSGGELNVYGGTMIGGYVKQNGGCIKADGANSVVNIMGGTIQGGTSGDVGGCIYVRNTLNMAGGTVDGEIYIAQGGAMLASSPVITELTLAEGVLVDINGLGEGASIGINAEGIFTTEMESPAEYLRYLKSVDDTKDITPVGNVLTCSIGKGYYDKHNAIHTTAEKMTDDGIFATGGTVTAVCPVCEQEVTWTDFNAYVAENGTTVREDGHYYLSADATISSHYSIYANVCLHLNGHNITSAARAIYVDATSTTLWTMNIMGEGTVNGAGVDHATIPRGTVDVGGCVNFYGGTYVATGSNPTMTARGFIGRSIVNIYDGAEFVGNSANMFISSQTVNVYGGKFTGGTTRFNNALNALNVYGGTFSGDGLLVYASGAKSAFNINGGIFDGIVGIEDTLGTFAVTGEPVITHLDLTSGRIATFQNLSGNAKIGVNAIGAFTAKFDNAKMYLDAGYIVPALPDMTIFEKNGVLIADAVDPNEAKNAIHTAAEKMTADGVFNNGGTVTATCPVCGTEEQWIDITTVEKMTSIKTAGHYYLPKNVQNTTYYGFYADACLHLNGHNITSTERAIYVDATGTTLASLNIMGEGAVTGAGVDHATLPKGTLDIGGSINLFGGTYAASGNNPALTARGYNGRSIANIYDGAEFVAPKTSLLVHSQAVNMYGGLITSGTVTMPGTSGSSFNVYGGTISNSNAGQAAVNAGGSMADLTIAGGEISGTVVIGATVKSVSVSGAPVINNLDLISGKLLTVGVMEEGAAIAVSATGVFTDALTNAKDVVGFFAPVDPDLNIEIISNKLYINNIAKLNKIHEAAEKITTDGVFSASGEIVASCPVCETEVTWKELNTVSGNALASGHYYLSADLQRSTHFSVTGTGTEVCLHLNGKNITSEKRVLYVEYTTVNIMGEGVVTGGFSDDSKPRFASVIDSAGNVNLYGGTYKSTTDKPIVSSRSDKDHYVAMYEGASIVRDASVPGVNVHAYDNGDFVMYGGVISGGSKTDGNGANVYVTGTNTTRGPAFTMYGGVIENGTAVCGGNVYASGVMSEINLFGGTIKNGEIYVESVIKVISVSGKPVISDLNLTSGKKLVVGELAETAEIYVTADGVFTEANDLIADYLAFFKTAMEGKTVKIDGKTLTVA